MHALIYLTEGNESEDFIQLCIDLPLVYEFLVIGLNQDNFTIMLTIRVIENILNAEVSQRKVFDHVFFLLRFQNCLT